MDQATNTAMIPLYRTALNDQMDRLAASFQSILAHSEVGDALDCGNDQCFAINVASESLVQGAEALLRVSQELKTRAILAEETPVNDEAAHMRRQYAASRQAVDAVVERVARECKDAIADIMREVGK